MSLINQMLQELEQRKATAEVGVLKQMAHPVQAVAAPRKNRVLQYAVLGLVCIGGAYAMQALSQRVLAARSATYLPNTGGVINEANAHVKSFSIDNSVIPAAMHVTHAVNAAAHISFVPSLEKTLNVSSQLGALDAIRNAKASTAKASANTVVAAYAPVKSTLDVAAPVSTTHTVQSDNAQTAGEHLALANTTPLASPVLAKPALPKQSVPNSAEPKINKLMSAEQKSAHAYQQAISYLQQGRVAEAQDQLATAVELYPLHDDARQTLVGLLVDNKRLEQAMQVLQTGLQLAPNHAGYAQTLARLQLDAGLTQAALNTLEAHSNNGQQPDAYYALMAVILQKTGQHAQAIVHYQQALSHGALTPAWLIGMGVSLQAEGRAAEAKQAYQQAQSSQLSAELAQFVTQRLKQIH